MLIVALVVVAVLAVSGLTFLAAVVFARDDAPADRIGRLQQLGRTPPAAPADRARPRRRT